jgi:hypothetical protein
MAEIELEQPIYEKRNEKRLAKMRAYNKKYYEQNKEQLTEEKKEKVCCEICNQEVSKFHLPKHKQTFKCRSARKAVIDDFKNLLKLLCEKKCK